MSRRKTILTSDHVGRERGRARRIVTDEADEAPAVAVLDAPPGGFTPLPWRTSRPFGLFGDGMLSTRIEAGDASDPTVAVVRRTNTLPGAATLKLFCVAPGMYRTLLGVRAAMATADAPEQFDAEIEQIDLAIHGCPKPPATDHYRNMILVAAISEVPAVKEATPDQLRQAVEQLIAIRRVR